MVTPILLYFHNNAALQLQWDGNQARELWMLPLCTDSSASEKGEGLF